MLHRDLRQALRWLRQNPGFTSGALLILAIGSGATVVTFTVVHAVLLRPLPFAAPDRIIRIWSSPQGRDLPFFAVSAPDAVDWRARAVTLAQVAPYERQQTFTLEGGPQPEELFGAKVSRELFELLGIQPVRGRWFTPDEDRPGSGARVAVISAGVWQRRFGGRADIVGQVLRLQGEDWTVIGVMPAGFEIPNNPAEIWLPLQLVVDPAKRDARTLRVLARLRDGASIEQATEELTNVAAALEQEYPVSNRTWTVTVRALTETVVTPGFRRALLIVAGAVVLVLLIACVNVTSLLVSRAAARTREMAIRTALGASRGVLVRQMLIESLVLAVLGGALGVLLAAWGLDALESLALTTIPRAPEIALRPAVLLFTCGVTTVTAVLFGLAPALGASRATSEARRARETSQGRAGRRASDLLLVAQVALATVLLVGAGLMIRSFVRLQQRELGFTAERLLVLQVAPPSATPARQFYEALLGRLAALPGVASVSAGNSLPFAGPNGANVFGIQGRTFRPGESPDADLRLVTPGYFETMGIRLLQGRTFTATDNESAPAIIVNQALARQFLQDEDPIGRYLEIPGEKPAPIIGVVESTRYFALEDPRDAVRPMIYFPALAYQRPTPAMTVAVRTMGSPERLIGAVRNAALEIARDQPLTRLEPMEAVLAQVRGPQRFNATLLGAFAWIALVLAVAGVWALIAHAVALRTREIGIRVALGASATNVLWITAGRGVGLAAAGIAVGLLGASGLTGLLQRVLYEVSATDPATFVVIPTAFLAVAGVASLLPALRALRIDPTEALRVE